VLADVGRKDRPRGKPSGRGRLALRPTRTLFMDRGCGRALGTKRPGGEPSVARPPL
jgi:hypothetical protein